MGDAVKIGQIREIRVTFEAGTPLTETDPTSVELTVIAPSGERTVYGWPGAVTRESVGKFMFLLEVTMSGQYRWIWKGLGALKQTHYGEVFVEPVP